MAIKISDKLFFETYSDFNEFIKTTCRTMDSIKEFMISNNLSKWDIMFAYQRMMRGYYNPQVSFEEFINSDLFTAKEFYDEFIVKQTYADHFFTIPKLQNICDKINTYKHWHDVTNYDELMVYYTWFFNRENGITEMLDYFETHNQDMYAQLIPEKPARFYFKRYSEEELFQKSDILLDYINSNLDEDLQNMPSAIPDSSVYEELVGSRRLTILKLCMRNPEKAINTIQKLVASRYITLKDFKGIATIEQVNALPREIKLVLKHPELRWTIHTSAKHICYSMPKGQEWKVFEYFAVKDPEMARSVINFCINSSLIKMSRNLIVEHYKDVDPEKIPPFIQEYIDESIKLYESQVENGKQNADWRKIENETRKLHWLNGKNELIQYFKLDDGIPIGSKTEYFKIAYFFRDSGLSAQGFCNQYQIKEVEGFREMLRRVADEDPEFGKFYEEFSAKKQKDHLSSCSENILSIVENPQSIPEIIEKSSSSTNLSNLVKISQYICDDPQIAESLIENVIRYYHTRLNSYDMTSLELEEVNKMLTFKEILFILEPEILDKIKNSSNVDMVREFMKSFGPYKDKLTPELRKLLNASNNSIRERLKYYSYEFNRQTYMKNSTQLPDANGNLVTINDDMIDMAMCYAHEHNLFRTSMVMNKIIKAVADGRIQNQAETEEYKNQLKEKIIQKMASVKQLNSVILSNHKPPQPLDE